VPRRRPEAGPHELQREVRHRVFCSGCAQLLQISSVFLAAETSLFLKIGQAEKRHRLIVEHRLNA
jgi:hypothetical protein